MRHSPLYIGLLIAVGVTLQGCSCNPVGRWAQEEISRSDEAMAHTLSIAGKSIANAASLDGWRAAIAPSLKQSVKDIERDTAYTKQSSGKIATYVTDETARGIPYTARAAASTVDYVTSELGELGSWFCCNP